MRVVFVAWWSNTRVSFFNEMNVLYFSNFFYLIFGVLGDFMVLNYIYAYIYTC